MTRRTLLLAAVVVTVAACSNDEASGPATAGVGSATTVDTAPLPTAGPETTTTEVPPATTTSTTEPGPTTTALPGPTDPTGRTVAVFASTPGGGDQGWVPIGGWTGNAFVDADATNAPRWTQGQEVRVSALGARTIGSEIGSDVRSCSGADGPRVRVPVSALQPADSGFAALAVEGAWALRPRAVAGVRADIPEYVDAARELLQGRAPSSTPGEVVQIVLADMNGDGEELSVVVFESTETPADDGSGFSLLFTYDNATGGVAELDSDVVAPPPEPEPEPEPEPSVAASTTTRPPPPPLERFRVLDVADLNGDRVYELVTKSWTDDEHNVQLYELAGRGFSLVGESTCDR